MNRQALQARWATLAPREQAMVAAAVGVLVLALLWWVALGPAVSTLRGAEAQHQALDAQLARMQGLQEQTRAMQALPKQNPEEAVRQLDLSLKQQLGPAYRYSIVGDRATVTLTNVPPAALAQFLAQVRTNARAIPGEAKLTRNPSGGWDGSVVLALPTR